MTLLTASVEEGWRSTSSHQSESQRGTTSIIRGTIGDCICLGCCKKRGYLSKMKVLVVSAWDDDKFTTENDGESVRVRRDETRDHTFDKVNLAPCNIGHRTTRYV